MKNLLFSESESLFVKIGNGKKNATFGSVFEDLGLLHQVFIFFFVERLPLLSWGVLLLVLLTRLSEQGQGVSGAFRAHWEEAFFALGSFKQQLIHSCKQK